MRFLGRSAGLMLMAMVTIGCSGASSDSVAPTTSDPATTSTGSTVSARPTSTSTVTSTAAPSITVPLSDEEAVLAVFEAYMGFEFDERANGYGPSEDRIEQYTTGALRERALETLQARKDAEAFLVGRTTTRVESVTVDGDTAEVLMCFLDTTTAFFEDGEVADPPAAVSILVRLPFVRADGRWLVQERFSGGDSACEL